MSAIGLRDIRQAIANRIHTRTQELTRKLTAQELSTKTDVPEAHAVPIPVGKYVRAVMTTKSLRLDTLLC